jgi:hypothetical protein
MLPVMSTGATDMAFLRQKGVQCFGIGPMIDSEDGPKGFGAHSDQERILEEASYKFVRFNWDVTVTLAAKKNKTPATRRGQLIYFFKLAQKRASRVTPF